SAVPLLALAGAWQIAVVLIIAERMGRGIRSPVRDAMLSHAASRTGLGWGFGLHQALDQLGAVAGPLVVSGVLFVGSGYRAAFGWLLIPAVLSMAVLLAARYLFPGPMISSWPRPPSKVRVSHRSSGSTSSPSPSSPPAMRIFR